MERKNNRQTEVVCVKMSAFCRLRGLLKRPSKEE